MQTKAKAVQNILHEFIYPAKELRNYNFGTPMINYFSSSV